MAVRKRSLKRPKRAKAPAPRAEIRKYTAQDLADICEVDLKTIHHWVTRGKLPERRTHGGHLRFRRPEVVRFLRRHGYPLPASVTRVRGRVGVATPLPESLLDAIVTFADVHTFANGAVAIAHLLADELEALVVRPDDPSIAGEATLGAIAAAPATSFTTIVLLEEDADGPTTSAARTTTVPTEEASLDEPHDERRLLRTTPARLADDLARVLVLGRWALPEPR